MYKDGDTFAYYSVTMPGHLVIWQRYLKKWWPSDFMLRPCTATDEYMMEITEDIQPGDFGMNNPRIDNILQAWYRYNERWSEKDLDRILNSLW